MSKELQSTSLLDILPENLLADAQIYAAARALDDELQKVTAATRDALILPRIDELSEEVVDLLAWQWSVDFYDELKSLEEKRNAVKQSIAMHRIKGTRRAVELALHMVYTSGEVSEWFEYGGRPYYFRVRFIEPENIRTEDVDRVSASSTPSRTRGAGLRASALRAMSRWDCITGQSFRRTKHIT